MQAHIFMEKYDFKTKQGRLFDIRICMLFSFRKNNPWKYIIAIKLKM